MEKNYREKGSRKRSGRSGSVSMLWVIAAITLMSVFSLALISLNHDHLDRANSGSYQVIERISDTPVPEATTVPLPDLPFESTESPDAPDDNSLQISSYSTLKENDTYPSVRLLQDRLIELGYLDGGETSDMYNSATAAAVSLYQRTIDAEVNGIADSALQEKLYSSDARTYEMELGDAGSDVKRMQSRLSELGYYTGKQSGYFGAETQRAVLRFQKKNQTDQTGILGTADRTLLYSPEARPAVDPTPTPSPTPKATPKSSKPKNTKKPSTTSSGGSSATVQRSYTASHNADGLVSVVKAQMDKPYVWSEEGPNAFDCSGLVYFCLKTCGVHTSRYSSSGFSRVDKWKNITSIGDLRPGDLVFFKSDSDPGVNHTGIYIGSNHFIHASFSSGKVVRSNITGAYWVRNFVNGRRVF